VYGAEFNERLLIKIFKLLTGRLIFPRYKALQFVRRLPVFCRIVLPPSWQISPDGRGSSFLCNAGELVPDYTVSSQKAAFSLVIFVSESGDERSPFAGRDKTFAVLACFRRRLFEVQQSTYYDE